MAADEERFRLKLKWLRDDQGNLIAKRSGSSEHTLEDINGVIYFSGLQMGSPYEAILVHAADDVHNTKLRRIELTFEDLHLVLERTEERATIGDLAQYEED